MARIHNILQGSEFYYELALEQIADSDFTAAIKNLHKAIKLSKKDKYAIELAELYHTVGANEASNQVYFKLLATRPAMDYLLAISRNYIYMNREELAAEFAYKTLISLGKKMSDKPVYRLNDITEGEKLQRVFSRSEDSVGPVLINIAELKEEDLMQQAYMLFGRGDYDAVIMNMLTIPKSSNYYVDALELICIAALENDDKDTAVEHARQLALLDKKSVAAFRAFLRYKAPITEGEEYDEDAIINDFISVLSGERDDDMLRSLASLLYVEKKYKHFYHAVLAAYTINDASRNNLFRFSLAALLMGKKEEGERTLNKFIELYPDDKLAKLMKWRYLKNPDTEDWKKPPSDFFAGIIDDYYEMAEEDTHGYITEKERELLDLILTGTADDVIDIIYDALDIGKKGTEDYMVDKLIDSDIDPDVRLSILRALIEYGVERKIKVLLPDRMAECVLKDLGKLPDYATHFILSYSESYSELLISGYKPSPQRLGMIIRGLAATLSTSKRANIVAAVAHYHYVLMEGDNITITELAEIYGTTNRTIKKYLEIYKTSF